MNNDQNHESEGACSSEGCGCDKAQSGSSHAQPVDEARRGLLVTATYLTGGLAALFTGVPILGFLTGPLRRREDQWTNAGDVDDFPVGETRLVDLKNPLGKSTDGDTGKVAVYVRHLAEGEFKVLSVYCTHLGCPVNWFPEAGLFLCPCHGGAYYDDGSRASGPPPRGLYEYDVRVEKGKLLVKLGHLPTLSDPA